MTLLFTRGHRDAPSHVLMRWGPGTLNGRPFHLEVMA